MEYDIFIDFVVDFILVFVFHVLFVKRPFYKQKSSRQKAQFSLQLMRFALPVATTFRSRPSVAHSMVETLLVRPSNIIVTALLWYSPRARLYYTMGAWLALFVPTDFYAALYLITISLLNEKTRENKMQVHFQIQSRSSRTLETQGRGSDFFRMDSSQQKQPQVPFQRVHLAHGATVARLGQAQFSRKKVPR